MYNVYIYIYNMFLAVDPDPLSPPIPPYPPPAFPPVGADKLEVFATFYARVKLCGDRCGSRFRNSRFLLLFVVRARPTAFISVVEAEQREVLATSRAGLARPCAWKGVVEVEQLEAFNAFRYTRPLDRCGRGSKFEGCS